MTISHTRSVLTEVTQLLNEFDQYDPTRHSFPSLLHLFQKTFSILIHYARLAQNSALEKTLRSGVRHMVIEIRNKMSQKKVSLETEIQINQMCNDLFISFNYPEIHFICHREECIKVPTALFLDCLAFRRELMQTVIGEEQQVLEIPSKLPSVFFHQFEKADFPLSLLFKSIYCWHTDYLTQAIAFIRQFWSCNSYKDLSVNLLKGEIAHLIPLEILMVMSEYSFHARLLETQQAWTEHLNLSLSQISLWHQEDLRVSLEFEVMNHNSALCSQRTDQLLKYLEKESTRFQYAAYFLEATSQPITLCFGLDYHSQFLNWVRLIKPGQVCFHGSLLQAEDFQYLGTYLTSVTKLDFLNVYFAPEWLKGLSCYLKELSIENNEALTNLSSLPNHLEILSLKGTSVNFGQTSGESPFLSSLHQLFLFDAICRDGIFNGLLVKCVYLTTLYLDKSTVTNDIAKHLPPRLERLSLRNCLFITSDIFIGLRDIIKNPLLREVNITGTVILPTDVPIGLLFSVEVGDHWIPSAQILATPLSTTMRRAHTHPPYPSIQ